MIRKIKINKINQSIKNHETMLMVIHKQQCVNDKVHHSSIKYYIFYLKSGVQVYIIKCTVYIFIRLKLLSEFCFKFHQSSTL